MTASARPENAGLRISGVGSIRRTDLDTEQPVMVDLPMEYVGVSPKTSRKVVMDTRPGRRTLPLHVTSDGAEPSGKLIVLSVPSPVLAMLLLGTGSLVLGLYQIGFSPFAPILGAFGGLAATNLLTRIGPGAFRRRVDEVFGPSLSRHSLRQLYDGPASNLQSPFRRHAAVLVLHTSNHNNLLETMAPDNLGEMHRAYLSLAAEHLAAALLHRSLSLREVLEPVLMR
jgi:hypothetical protein